MSDVLSKVLSSDEIGSLESAILDEAQAGRKETAWHKVQPLRKAQHHQKEAAEAVLRIITRDCLEPKGAAEILLEIVHSHPDDLSILTKLAMSLETVRDIDDLNAPPAHKEVFQAVLDRLGALTDDAEDPEPVLSGLATTARLMARQHDDIAERCYRKLVEIDPDECSNHYNLGLFMKTRGRFEEGMRANQKAKSLVDEDVESYEWNLGICATGAGHGTVALDVWKRMGQKIEMGRFGLPEGRYPECKVKLAERPLAERTTAMDDPGLEETIWIERLSPCHGIIRSVLYQDLGVDYGDVVLIDGAPITYHTYGDIEVPVFPHLATLVRHNYQFFDFAGTQDEPRQLANASVDLDADTIVYSHSENYRELCASCWRDPDIDHEHRERLEKHVVLGRIAAPRHVDPTYLLDQLDKAIAKRTPCQIYAPDLCDAAGAGARADVDRRRFHMLSGN